MHENSLSVSKFISFTLLFRPTNAQHTHTHTYMYIHINNILYTVSTPTCFDASASSSGVLSFYCAENCK